MYIQIGHQSQLDLPLFDSFNDLVEQLNDLFGEQTFILEKNGRKIDLNIDQPLSNDDVWKIWPKVLGGKGGFGSLLRSFGKQILISKNKEACRDLNGRRIRDVNNEKKLKEWAQKELEKAATSSTDNKNKTKKAEESNDYRNVPPPHKFSDSAYDEQKKQISDDMNEAVQIAAELLQKDRMKKKKKSPTAVSTNDDDEEEEEAEKPSAKKRRHSEDELEDGELKISKKTKAEKGANRAFFIGIDLDDLASDDDEDEGQQDQSDAKKKKVSQKS